MHCLQAARNGIYQTKERAENERQSRLLNSLLACGPSISAEHQARDLFSGLKREIWGCQPRARDSTRGLDGLSHLTLSPCSLFPPH